ncbi:hypothetical protein PB01_08150 [Psychrobacillus glaciei]|uniref:Uncharacterized protein n=1 Tax=Psychrobacillus glaciei TaxID=2283160 RepID=A0A5J6SLN0_9BACI|nr:hypothetical protein PB01_08150 [Psychrobacillus glaciei]
MKEIKSSLFYFHWKTHILFISVMLILYSFVVFENIFIYLIMILTPYIIFIYYPYYKETVIDTHIEDDDEYWRQHYEALHQAENMEFTKFELIMEILTHVFYWLLLGFTSFTLYNGGYPTISTILGIILICYCLWFLAPLISRK